MDGSVAEDAGAPESWEVADLDRTMSRLMLSTPRKDVKKQDLHLTEPSYVSSAPPSPSLPSVSSSSGKASEDAINQVDQFLREALQNPRERLSVLRLEQDIEKFVRDPTRKQLEFQQIPTSYLRLAAHRIAQHYSLQSMVLSDNCSPDGSGSKIIVYKSSDCQLPMIRLADIPFNSPSEESGVVKVAIKQRPQKRPDNMGNGNSDSLKSSGSKSVEERKEEYNRARARIFNSNNDLSNEPSRRVETEPMFPDNSLHGSFRFSKIEEKPGSGVSDVNSLIDSSMSNSRVSRSRIEEPIGRYRPNSRVAIFRDREVDRNDPDYNRSYDRYMQRFDPGFGFDGGPYAMQAMYSPALNYNTEFPQLGSPHRPPISSEHQPRPIAQHLPGTWVGHSAPAGIGYGHGHLETMMTPFNPNVGARPSSALYLHSSQYLCQGPGMPFIHPHEQVLQPYSQSHQQLPDATFGVARPRGSDSSSSELYEVERDYTVMENAQRKIAYTDIMQTEACFLCTVCPAEYQGNYSLWLQQHSTCPVAASLVVHLSTRRPRQPLFSSAVRASSGVESNAQSYRYLLSRAHDRRTMEQSCEDRCEPAVHEASDDSLGTMKELETKKLESPSNRRACTVLGPQSWG